MKPREVQTYSELAEAIWTEAETRYGQDEHIAAREWYEQTFCLSALGDALALARGWKLAGLEAIEYALIQRHSWLPDQIRQLSPRDKWLSLHEELAGLKTADDANQAWWDREVAKLNAKDSAEDVWRAYPRGFPIP